MAFELSYKAFELSYKLVNYAKSNMTVLCKARNSISNKQPQFINVDFGYTFQ